LEVVAAVAVLSSFCAGLMGIGGGIIMAPILLYMPHVFHVPGFPIKLVATLTIIQDLVGSMSAALTHHKYRFLNRELLLHMGIGIGVSAFVGGLLSHYAAENHIAGALTFFITVAAVSMVLSNTAAFQPETADGQYRRGRATLVSVFIGLIAGFIGQGSAFILIPSMLLVLRLPLRVAVSNALGVVFCASLGGFLGKWGTHPIPVLWVLILLAAAAPSAYLGTYVSHRASSRVVRILLTVLLVVAALEAWRQVLFTGVGRGSHQ